MTKKQRRIPDRSKPGLTMTAPSATHQDGGEKYATGDCRRRGRDWITVGTWNVRTLSQEGKLEELVHEMSRYRWNLLGLCEMRWKHFGQTLTEEGHRVYYSGKSDRHEEGVGFLVHRDITKTVIGCQPISSRLISIRLRASPFNITIIQVYAPTTGHSDEEADDFYQQVQGLIDQTPKKDVLIVQGDWNAKVGTDAQEDWEGVCGPNCNEITNDRGLKLLEFATYNNLVLTNTLAPHKPSRRWTWHSPDGKHHNQIDYILIRNRFRTGVNIARTRSFPGADIGSDHDLLMMTFKLRLKNLKKPNNIRIKYDIEKLRDPKILQAFQAEIGGQFAPLTILNAEEMDIEKFTTAFNEGMTQTASRILGKRRHIKKPWVTSDILDACDDRRALKNRRFEPEGAVRYKEAKCKVRRMMKAAKEKWIDECCGNIEYNLTRNDSKKAYQLVKDLTKEKQAKVTTVKDKSGECLTEEQDILNRWTEYCSELYNHHSEGDPAVLDCPATASDDSFPILREEVEVAVKSLKKGKAPGIDNIPAELLQAGGDCTTDALTKICNKIWKTGVWPTPWTQSLVITLPKKGDLQQCQNYRTISLISHPSKVMLKVILNRLKPQAEEIIAEEQAGFRAGRSTTEQIFNLNILCEKYLQHQQELHHVFIDFKKAFDRVWHPALWATMRKYNISENLVKTIQQLYDKACSAVLINGEVGEWFRTAVGVRQGCLLSPTLFNIFLERIMSEALEEHEGTVSIGGRNITNLRFADDIDGLAGTSQELRDLIHRLDQASTKFGMEISAEKTKLMSNNAGDLRDDILINGQRLETVTAFKYLGSIVTDDGSKPEVLARLAQTVAAVAKLKPIWKDSNISLPTKVRLMRTLVLSIFLYACETWTLTAELERRIQSLEMRCFRRILNISYKDHITNEEVRSQIRAQIGPYEDLLTTVRKRKLRWYGHVSRSSGLAKTILQGTVNGARRRGRQKKRWEDNVKEWTGLSFASSQRAVEDRVRWREIVMESAKVPLRPMRLREK